jgi:hypothetical protein
VPLNPSAWPVVVGVSWYTGTGVPSASLGVDGDLYLDTATGNVYQNTAGVWAVISTVAGAGATWYSGRGSPASSLGNNGDFYLQTNNGQIWEKLAGTWTKVQAVSTTASGDAWTTVIKPADQSIANQAALQNDTDLFFATVAGAIYRVELFIVYASPAGGATPGLKIGLGEDATARGTIHVIGANSGNAVVSQGVSTNSTSPGINFITAATNRGIGGLGVHWGNGGTFRFLWAQNTAGAGADIVRATSYLRYIKVA